MLVFYFVPFIVSNRYLLFRDSNGHNTVTVQNRTHVYMNFFDYKDLGNHLLQLCPKVVKHPVYIYIFIYLFTFDSSSEHFKKRNKIKLIFLPFDNYPKRCNRMQFILIYQLHNMFRVVFQSKSVSHNTVSTVHGINVNCTAACRERGWAGTDFPHIHGTRTVLTNARYCRYSIMSH